VTAAVVICAPAAGVADAAAEQGAQAARPEQLHPHAEHRADHPAAYWLPIAENKS
jgi:hypothetical protein